MRLATLFGPDLKQTLADDPEEVREALEEFHPEDIAEMLPELEEDVAIALVRALPDARSADVLDRLDQELRAKILERLGTNEAATLLTAMSSDERVDAIQELPESVAEKILDRLEETEPDVAEEVRELAAYPEHSAGALMTTDYIASPPETKVWRAIEAVRDRAREREAETIYYVYVLAYGDKLVGVVSLRDLILGDPSMELEGVMTENVVRVSPLADQEEVAKTIAKYDLHAIPVCDDNGVMLGVVTVDDVVDVVIEEATEDAQRMGAVVPTDETYLDTSFWAFVRKRAGWLIVLFGAELVTTNVLHRFEARLEDMLIFVPLLTSSGGNSGSQTSSLIIRALAVGEIRPHDWLKVLWRELSMGLVLGGILGVLGFFRALIAGTAAPFATALVVAASLLAIVTMGTLVGSLLPLGIKRAGLDPAVSSTPFIASLVDVLGLAVYFTIAKTIFALTLP